MSFVAHDPFVWTGRALQAESFPQWLVLRFCIRPLRGADRSWPSWISARVRSQLSDGPSKARWATRSRTRNNLSPDNWLTASPPPLTWSSLIGARAGIIILAYAVEFCRAKY